jgi:hypothetical protein
MPNFLCTYKAPKFYKNPPSRIGMAICFSPLFVRPYYYYYYYYYYHYYHY